MGHANLSNISEFFINRLYAKGSLSIIDCAKALVAAGEALRASEGPYHDEDMLRMGLADVIYYLTCENPARHGYSGPTGGGPWIVPDLNVWLYHKSHASKEAQALLQACTDNPLDDVLYSIAADKLEDEGLTAWATGVRSAGRRALAYRQYTDQEDENWGYDEGELGDVFDNIPWRFAPGWRKRYRDVPRLGNVTH